MHDAAFLSTLLDSLKDPFLFADANHVIRYMNKAAVAHYKEGASLLGRSLFDCHNEQSRRQMVEILAAMQAGEEERLITDDDKHRIYMRAVRDADGRLLGYYERYEPPLPGRAARTAAPPAASGWIRTVACVSTGRADAGIYAPLLAALGLETKWTTLCLAGGTHHAAAFGRTIDDIAAPPGVRLVPVEHLVPGDDSTAVAATAARAVEAFSRALAEARVDLLFVLGDRTEMLAAALAAVIHRIPIVHLHGGDLTEGAYDDQCRHALTKLAHVHFPAIAEHADRIISMGEESWRVHCVGALALDALRDFKPEPADRLGREFGLDFSKPVIVVSLHPETLSDLPPEQQVDALISALGGFDAQFLILGPNADVGHDRLRLAWERFAAGRANAKVVSSMPQARFWSSLARAALLVGNSSAGILEAASFRVPVVNVGDRQKGRRRGANVLDAPFDAAAIAAAVEKALAPAFKAGLANLANPYGDGRTAERIIAALRDLPERSILLHKKWPGAR